MSVEVQENLGGWRNRGGQEKVEVVQVFTMKVQVEPRHLGVI